MLRKTFILKPRLQLKYLVLSLVVVCLTGLAVYYAFWSSLVSAPGLEQLSAGEWRALQRAYQNSFIWVVVILVFIVGLETIFLFHRLFGPLYVFEKVLKSLSTGDLTASVHSRKNDELKEMAAQIQGMIGNMSSAVEEDRRRIGDINRQIDEGKLSEAKENLSRLTCWYKID